MHPDKSSAWEQIGLKYFGKGFEVHLFGEGKRLLPLLLTANSTQLTLKRRMNHHY